MYIYWINVTFYVSNNECKCDVTVL